MLFFEAPGGLLNQDRKRHSNDLIGDPETVLWSSATCREYVDRPDSSHEHMARPY